MSLFRSDIEQMHGYVPGYQPRELDAVKLNTNENPYPPSPRVFEAISQVAPESLRRYPPVLWDEFRRAVSDVLNVPAERIVCGNGGDEILTILVRCCCDAARPLAYPVPTYTLYRELAEIQGCRTEEVPFEDFGRLPSRLFGVESGLTIVCNPNAPTGTLVAKDDIHALARAAKGVLLIDEAYVDFAGSDCLDMVDQYDNVAVLRSLSKGYSLAGMRLGFCVASERIVEAMLKVKDSYNLNMISQVAAAAALRDQAYFQENVQRIVVERDRLYEALQGFGFEIAPSHTNFLWSRVPDRSAREVYDALRERHIYVRYFDEPGLNDKLRITVGTAKQNDRLLAALQEIFGAMKQ